MLAYMFCTALSLLIMQSPAAAFEISLTADPGVIKAERTDTLTLRCSLLEPSVPSNTCDDMEQVNSIIVFKGAASTDTPVARIFGTNSAEAMVEDENLDVSGTLNVTSSSVQAFLELVWTNPGQNQSGQYKCEIYGLDKLGRSAALVANADVINEAPDYQGQIDFIRQNIEDLENVIIDQSRVITSLEETVADMKSVLRAPHTEQGSVECSNYENEWQTFDDSSRRVDTPISFQTPYTDVPAITVSVLSVDISNQQYIRYWVAVLNLSRTGFTIRCGTWADTYVYNLRVSWTSTVA